MTNRNAGAEDAPTVRGRSGGDPADSEAALGSPPSAGRAGELLLDLCVDADASAVPLVRRRLSAALSAAPPPLPQLCADIAIVAGELVTNALLHGAPPVRLRLVGGAAWVRIEVNDASEVLPVRPRDTVESMTGRGLALVDALAADWGTTANGGGKIVWAELAADGHPPSPPAGA
ncbi:MAG: ATP-binding protein, partial [Frankia sp.]|nr:ATP-binding protein [Frankia sp.]